MTASKRSRLAGVVVTGALATAVAGTSIPASGATAAPLTQTDVHTVVVNWGSKVDPAQAAAAAGVLDALDNSGYLRGLASEYALSPHAGYLGAGVIPDSALPATTDASAIDAAIAARVSSGALPKPQGSTDYVVMLPPGVTPADASSNAQFCSSHHAAKLGTTRAYVIVVSDYTDTAQQCGGTAKTAVAAASVNVTRQLVNAITDPLADGSGLHSGAGAEIGDACATPGLTGNVDGLAVQPWWSNSSSSCGFGITGLSVTGDVGSVTNARFADFRLHDTAASSSPPSFACTLDEASVSCAAAHPLSVTDLAAGSHALDVSANGLGDATYSWLVDVSPPVATLSPVAPVTVARTVAVAYGGTDTGGAGVSAYDVRYRSAAWNGGFGRWLQPPAWQGTASRRVTLSVQPGHAYCFAVRAHDRADNVSTSWSASRCTAVPVDDRSLAATAGWHRGSSAAAFRGTLSSAAANGERLQLVKARVRQVALVVRTCPSCGRIAVYRGGVLWRTVNTKRAASHNRFVVMLPAIGLRTTTISLRVVGSGRPVYVDGLAILPT